MIPQLKRILEEDLPGAPSWISTLLRTLNKFMQDTYSILNNGITLQDNIKCEVKEFTLTAPILDYFISSKITVPTGVLLLGVFGIGSVAPSLQWEPAQGGVNIAVSGLNSGNAYKVRILIV